VSWIDRARNDQLGETVMTDGCRTCQECKDAFGDTGHVVECFEVTGQILCPDCWETFCDGQHDAGLVEMVAVTLTLSSGNKHPYKKLRASNLKAWEIQKTRAVECIGAVAAWLDGIGKSTAAAELRAAVEP